MTTSVIIQASEHAVRADLTEADGTPLSAQIVQPVTAATIYVYGDKRLVISEVHAIEEATPLLDELAEVEVDEDKPAEDTKPAA